MRIDRKSIDDYFIDYNLILRRSLPLPLRREGSADKRGMRIDRESVSSYFIGYNLILRRSLPLPLRREGSADKKRDDDRWKVY